MIIKRDMHKIKQRMQATAWVLINHHRAYVFHNLIFNALIYCIIFMVGLGSGYQWNDLPHGLQR